MAARVVCLRFTASCILACAWASACATATGVGIAGERPIDTFSLTAHAQDLEHYYPTYLANGFWSIGSSPLGVTPSASFAAGVMDNTPNDVSRPAELPIWNDIDYEAGDGWLSAADPRSSAFSDYTQRLDMHHGELATSYRWHTARGDTDISTMTFVSQSDARIAVVTLELRPQFSGSIHLRAGLRAAPVPQRLPLARMSADDFNAAATASNRPELAQGGNRAAIWYPGEVRIERVRAWAGGQTPTRRAALEASGHAIDGRRVALAAAVDLSPSLGTAHLRASEAHGAVELHIDAKVRAGGRYRLTKYVALSTGEFDSGMNVLATAAQARQQGLQRLARRHAAAWEALWRHDIVVGGDPKLQRTVHSDLFYLLENTAVNGASPAAACGFSSHYFGHVFWDNDFWVFPAVLLQFPERARSLIAYRQRTEPQALARAAAHGFTGAMYPWEADPSTGLDVTPQFAVENADREIHVNGAVALAQWQYYLATGDRDWLERGAMDVIAAVADFWVSRATFVATHDRYEILDVTSPEEDYVHVDNEIYTNAVAERSLRVATAAARVLGRAPNPRWAQVADGLYLPAQAPDGRIDDFDPSTPHDKTNSWMATSVPLLGIPALDFHGDASTLRGLLRHSVAAVNGVRDRANQMILVMLATQASMVGDDAYFGDLISGGAREVDPFLKPPFNVRSETPQNDSVYLLASSGGFVQALLYGASGLRLDQEGLVAKYPPLLPPSVTSLKFQGLKIREVEFDVELRRLPSGVVERKILRRAR